MRVEWRTESNAFEKSKLIRCTKSYHPSQFLCSQSWFHLRLWHVFLWSNQLCIWIVSFSHSWHSSNSSYLPSFCSDSSCEFTCLQQQTWLLQLSILCYLTSKSEQILKHSKPIGKCHYKPFKISHITPLLKTLHWLPIKQRIDYKICLLTYKTLANEQPTYLYNLVFHFRQILFLQNLLIHSFFPFYLFDHLHHLVEGLSLSLVHDSGIHSIVIPEIRLLCQ